MSKCGKIDMTSVQPQPPLPAAANPTPPPPASAAADHSPLTTHRSPKRICLSVAALLVLIVVGYFATHWFTYRFSHSITDDAFVEAHIVNIAPQSVSGHLVRVLVEENDRVEQGQML